MVEQRDEPNVILGLIQTAVGDYYWRFVGGSQDQTHQASQKVTTAFVGYSEEISAHVVSKIVA